MPDNETLPQLLESRVVPKKRGRISLVWIIPIVAAAAGVWIAVTKILSEGPEITITFNSAEGLEAGKTRIDFNGLTVGTITAIRLSDDNKHFIATAKMVPKAKELLVKDTKFWVVRPRISGLNISGLGTLISGKYIGMRLGQSRESQRDFVALDAPPITGDVSGSLFTLTTPELGSLGEGTPIYFRRLQAGQVVSYELDKDGKILNVRVFVQSPYDKFVTADTRFWQASGIEMSLSASGLKVQTESLLSILVGGVAFETPEAPALLPPAEPNTVFMLHSDREEAFRPPARDPQTYMLVFKQSVRGLAPGAPVEFEGIRIGEVTDIHAQFDDKTKDFSVPVTITVDPARFGVRILEVATVKDLKAARQTAMNALIARGLRIQLRTGSLLTGSLYVAADFFPDAPPATLDWTQDPVQLPTMPGSMESIEASLANILKKLDSMEFKAISDDLRKALGEIDTTLVTLRGTLTNTDKLLGTADKAIEPNSALIGGLDDTLQQVGGAARSLRVLADYLERHPEALIRGKTGNAKQ